jgi:hypothetical protein
VATPLNGFEQSPLTNVTVATFAQPGTQPAPAFGATIDWGDGTTSAGNVTGGNGSFAVLGSHTHGDERAFPVTVTLTGPFTAAALTTTANVLARLLPDGTRGTPEQRFIAEAFEDLLGIPVTQAALDGLTPLFLQGELRGVQAILSDPQLTAIAQALLGLPGGAQAVQNFVLTFGEVPVVQVIQAIPFYSGIANPGTTPLDQLMADYGQTLDRLLDPLGAAAFLPPLQSTGNDAVLIAILSAGPQEYFNKTRA